jgi:uncharacterized protein YcbK (DUF882 family)
VIATLSVAAARGTQDAAANGDTRTLTLFHTHTRESLTVTYRRNGQYDDRALEQLNWLLRDWRRDEPTRMDPRLFDILWEVYRETGSDEPIHVLSAYRSPKTNAMLRRRSSRVAEHSQHMLGKAMDFHLPDVSVDRIRVIGMRLQSGGVGYYPSSSFVHLDVGSVRAWPRMTRDQLLRLFPDGRTVHLPADGTPLPGYEEARAQVLARGGTVAGVTAVADGGETAAAPRRRGFWATLFGLDEDEDAEEIRATQTASRTTAGSGSALAVRYTPGDESSASNFLDSYNRWRAQQSAPQVAQRAPQPAPEPAPLVRVAEAPAPVREPAPLRLASLAAAPDGSAAPRLAWQGPGSAAEDLPPIPPRRPSDLPGALAFAQTPAARRDEAPISSGTALVGIPHPLPPPRPGGRPVQVAALDSMPVPVATGSVKTPAASRTAQPVATAPRAAGMADRPSSWKGDRLALKDPKPTKGAAPAPAPAPAPAGKTRAAASLAAAKSPQRSGDKPSPQRPVPKARLAAR